MNNWSRAQLKDRAKNVLRINYWMALLVALILAFASSGGSGSIGGSNTNYRFSGEEITFNEGDIAFNEDFEMDGLRDFGQFYKSIDFPGKNIFAGVAITAIILAILFSIAISVFLFNPLAVGCYKFFSSSAETPHKNMAPVGIAFKKGNYWGIVKTMFLKNLYIFLWSLLLVIPGIIKFYAYRMVQYIMADNPEMDANEAITLSRKMMDGEKWNAFVLDLSFIGWYLLGALACGIGVLFVNPYYQSTYAQLYLALRDKAINNRLCTPQMLNLVAN